MPVLAVSASAVLLLAGCGEKDESEGEVARAAPETASFPAPDGGSLDEFVAANRGTGEELVVSPAGQVFTVGRNRFGFGVFEVDHTQVTDADVAIYAAPATGGRVRGPFPARVESLETEPAFTAENTAADPDAAKVVYVTDLELDQPGEWRLAALVRPPGGEPQTATVTGPLIVNRRDGVPGPGDPAPKVHTPTADEVADISEIDTRVPPGTMHDVDLADALGKEPVVLLFATPALCQSRVCGPVVDVAEQVKRDRPDDAAYIHMEIYEDNIPDPNKLRSQVKAYDLPTEPWLFVIDADGNISTRIEGAFSAAELEEALDRVKSPS